MIVRADGEPPVHYDRSMRRTSDINLDNESVGCACAQRSRLVTSLAFAIAVCAVAGCEGKEDEIRQGTCNWGETGAAGAVSVTLDGAEVELSSRSVLAMNTVEIERESPIGPHRLGGARWGVCGGGLTFVERGAGAPQLMYADGATGAVEAIATFGSGDGPSLFFDADCAPVIVEASSGSFLEHRLDGGDWTTRVIFDPLSDLPAEGLTWISHVAADLGRDGDWHVFARAGGGGGGGERIVHGSRAAEAEADWAFEAIDGPEATQTYDWAVDSTGAFHVVYGNAQYPCDPCDLSLFHGRRNPSGSWAQSTVQLGAWGDPDDQLAVDASLAIDDRDQPVIAAQFQRRVITGSLTSATLRVYSRASTAEVFCAEEVVVESDRYAGSDGEGFTGATPAIEIDGLGRLHVLFADLSVWHTSDGANAVAGQLRYALRAGNAWEVYTVARQTGQTESPEPLVGASSLGLALSDDGDGALLVATEWEWATSSIYNMQEMGLEMRALLRSVDVTGR